MIVMGTQKPPKWITETGEKYPISFPCWRSGALIFLFSLHQNLFLLNLIFTHAPEIKKKKRSLFLPFFVHTLCGFAESSGMYWAKNLHSRSGSCTASGYFGHPNHSRSCISREDPNTVRSSEAPLA